MPIKINREKELIVPELNADPIELNYYEVMLFAKKVNPMLYFIGKEAYNSLVKMNVKDEDNIISEWQNYKDPEIINKVNAFLGTDLKFSDYLDKLLDDENRIIFNVKGTKKKDNAGIYFSVSKEKLEKDELTKAAVACMLNIYEMDPKTSKKKKVVYTYDDLISPWFWIDKLSTFFTRNNDSLKKFEKIKTMLVSLVRLVDDPTRKILPIKKEDKENTLTIMRYIIRDFNRLSVEDSQDLDNKRIRLFEYQLFPLRKYFSDQIYRVLNSPTRSRAVLERMFSNLSPMSIIKQTVTNELLRYYNSTNDMNLFSAFLKFTFRGPQSVNRTTSVYQQDVHPSYTGRLSLIASSAGSPGLSGTIVPFVEISDDYYFNKEHMNE